MEKPREMDVLKMSPINFLIPASAIPGCPFFHMESNKLRHQKLLNEKENKPDIGGKGE